MVVALKILTFVCLFVLLDATCIASTCSSLVVSMMTSYGGNDVSGRRLDGRSTNPWSKLVIASSVGGACAVFTACFVLCVLVCRRWARDKRLCV